jgi:hypothetical protein
MEQGQPNVEKCSNIPVQDLYPAFKAGFTPVKSPGVKTTVASVAIVNVMLGESCSSRAGRLRRPRCWRSSINLH